MGELGLCYCVCDAFQALIKSFCWILHKCFSAVSVSDYDLFLF